MFSFINLPNACIITPLQLKVVKTDFYLSKSTEVLAFKST